MRPVSLLILATTLYALCKALTCLPLSQLSDGKHGKTGIFEILGHLSIYLRLRLGACRPADHMRLAM